MKRAFLPTIFATMLSSGVSASEKLPEPDLNACSAAKGLYKCEVKCVRELGEQCLVTHVNFEGEKLSPGTELWRARFLTCRNADVDLQLKSLVLELEKIDQADGPGIVSANVSSTKGLSIVQQEKSTIFKAGQTEARISRLPFDVFLNSGENHMEASLKLEQCGAADGSNTCRISGKFVAVTNPNIRCDFHDTTQAGAFRPANLQISPSLTNSQQPVGRVGQ